MQILKMSRRKNLFEVQVQCILFLSYFNLSFFSSNNVSVQSIDIKSIISKNIFVLNITLKYEFV